MQIVEVGEVQAALTDHRDQRSLLPAMVVLEQHPGLRPADTTRMTASTISTSSAASGRSSTGGVSMTTHSNFAAASLIIDRIRSDVRLLIGSEFGRPAGSTDSRSDTSMRVSFRSSG